MWRIASQMKVFHRRRIQALKVKVQARGEEGNPSLRCQQRHQDMEDMRVHGNSVQSDAARA